MGIDNITKLSFFENGKMSKEDFEKVKDFYGCL